MLAVAGVTAIETSVAALTVNVVVAETLPDAAVMVTEPAATDAASPLEPAALLIVAMAVFEELQTTNDVRFCVELSE